MANAEIFEPEFRRVVDNLAGAEGPVFSACGSKFYMVAPEVEKDGKPAGQVYSVDTLANKVK